MASILRDSGNDGQSCINSAGKKTENLLTNNTKIRFGLYSRVDEWDCLKLEWDLSIVLKALGQESQNHVRFRFPPSWLYMSILDLVFTYC